MTLGQSPTVTGYASCDSIFTETVQKPDSNNFLITELSLNPELVECGRGSGILTI